MKETDFALYVIGFILSVGLLGLLGVSVFIITTLLVAYLKAKLDGVREKLKKKEADKRYEEYFNGREFA